MHPRSPFRKHPPNFTELAERYRPLLRPFIRKGSLDFSNPQSTRALSTALLKDYFSLDVEMPADSLCPAIPSRLDYVILIEDLAALNGLKSPVVLDIGCGACAVYCLLGSRWRPDFSWVGTEISDSSFASAATNVEKNHLLNVKVLKIPDPRQLIPDGIMFDICMCNPPFYADRSEMERSKLAKKARLSYAPMQDNEAVFEGGDAQFVKLMIDQSYARRDAIFSSLIGKKSSLEKITRYLSDKDITYNVRALQQGSTRRWIVIWTHATKLAISGIASPSQLRIQRFVLRFCEGDCTIATERNFWSRQARRGRVDVALKAGLRVRVFHREGLLLLEDGDWDEFISLCSHLQKTQSLAQ